MHEHMLQIQFIYNWCTLFSKYYYLGCTDSHLANKMWD